MNPDFNNSSYAYISEIFFSIQGEGLFAGLPQLFARFCGCNLSCSYCDTKKRFSNFCKISRFDFKKNSCRDKIENPVSINALLKIIDDFKLAKYNSISLTGNEPLMSAEFLKNFLPKLKSKKIFLETNGTLPCQLEKIIEYIDIISMDFKPNSVTKNNIDYSVYKEFIKISKTIFLYVKIVIDNNFSEYDYNEFLKLNIKKNIPIILQPVWHDGLKDIELSILLKLQSRLLDRFSDVRIIPQIHKFLKLK